MPKVLELVLYHITHLASCQNGIYPRFLLTSLYYSDNVTLTQGTKEAAIGSSTL